MRKNQTKKTKTKGYEIKRKVTLFFIVVWAAIGVMAAFIHKWYEYDPELDRLTLEYNNALANRNAQSKLYKETIDYWIAGKLTAEEFDNKKHIFIEYARLDAIRKAKKAPLTLYREQAKIRDWNDLSAFLFFIGLPVFSLIGISLFIFKIVYKLNDELSERIYKTIGLVYLAVPAFFIVHAVLHNSRLVQDFSLTTYNITIVLLALLTSYLIHKLFSWHFKIVQKEKELFRYKIRNLISFITRTRARYIKGLAEEAINEDNQQQIIDFVEQYEEDLTKVLRETAKK